MIKELTICGFRGFGKEQTVSFSLPDGERIGSGLSIMIGANNSGKTTIIEAIKLFNNKWQEIFFSEGRRNIANNKRVSISFTSEDGSIHSIKTVETGGAATVTENINDVSFM